MKKNKEQEEKEWQFVILSSKLQGLEGKKQAE